MTASRARRHGVLAATAAAAVAGSVVVAAPAGAAGPDPGSFAEGVTTEEVMTHLLELQAIADANGGVRASGTPGYDASADYVADVLTESGYEVERQVFAFEFSETLAESLAVVTPEARDVPVIAMTYTGSTPEGGITAPLGVPTGEATGCETADFGDLTGRIALISRGTCTFTTKQANAAAAGAVAAIVYNNVEGDLNGTLGEDVVDPLPTGGVTQAEGAGLVAAVGEGEVTVALELRALTEQRETSNVIATSPWGDRDDAIMLGAHLDSVTEGPGINDNGSGIAAILQTAVELADAPPTRNAVHFAFWGAEEAGLIGSERYVAREAEAGRLRDIAAYLNFDMVASPNYQIGVYDADQSTFQAPVPVPVGSTSLERVLTDFFASVDQPFVDTEFSGRSDYQPFIENGVPAGGLFTGAEGLKPPEQVALFGGTAGEAYDPNYHQPGDTIDNVDEEALGINTAAIAFAAARLADDPTPLIVDDTGDPTQVRRYVNYLYTDVLGRVPDEPGAQFWAGLLMSGLPREEAVRFFTTSAEYRGRVIGGAYSQVLGRVPSGEEVAYWRGVLEGGQITLDGIVATLTGSEEFLAVQGAGTPEGFVEALYTAVLSRPELPGPAELAYWEGLLESGLSRTDLAAAVLASPEYVAPQVVRAYVELLDRTEAAALDDEQGIAYWTTLRGLGFPLEDLFVALAASTEAFEGA